MEDSIRIPSHSQRGREKRKYRMNNDHFDRNTYINGAEEEEREEEELTVI